MPPGYERSAAELAAAYQDDCLFDDLYVNAIYRGRPVDAPRPSTASPDAGGLVNGARINVDALTDLGSEYRLRSMLEIDGLTSTGFREPLDSLRLPAYGAQRHFGLHADGTSKHTTVAADPGSEYRYCSPVVDLKGLTFPAAMQPLDPLHYPAATATQNVGLLGDGISGGRDTFGGPSSEYSHRRCLSLED